MFRRQFSVYKIFWRMSHLVLINIPMSWHIFRRLLPVTMNLFMTIPRLEKSFDDDFSSTNFFWSVLLLLIRLFMTSSRPEKSFKEKIIARSRPQNIFQDGKISSSYLKNTPRLDTSFYDISSSYEMFRKYSRWSRLETCFKTRRHHRKICKE